jgi:hypothetical protein
MKDERSEIAQEILINASAARASIAVESNMP